MYVGQNNCRLIAEPDCIVAVLNQALMWHWMHTRVMLVLPLATRARACACVFAPSGSAVLVRCCMCRAAQATMKICMLNGHNRWSVAARRSDVPEPPRQSSSPPPLPAGGIRPADQPQMPKSFSS